MKMINITLLHQLSESKLKKDFKQRFVLFTWPKQTCVLTNYTSLGQQSHKVADFDSGRVNFVVAKMWLKIYIKIVCLRFYNKQIFTESRLWPICLNGPQRYND